MVAKAGNTKKLFILSRYSEFVLVKKKIPVWLIKLINFNKKN